jgi:chaperonin GroES
LITTASTQFAARAYPAIVNGRSVVKGVIVGEDKGEPQIGPDGTPVLQGDPQNPQPVWDVPPGAKRIKADQIGEHMSWQLLDEMPEWEPETDQLLHTAADRRW